MAECRDGEPSGCPKNEPALVLEPGDVQDVLLRSSRIDVIIAAITRCQVASFAHLNMLCGIKVAFPRKRVLYGTLPAL
jgi:hypothetical protein